MLPTLYKRNTNGSIQEWTIMVKDNTFWTEGGQVGGAITASKPTVCHGKNIGKANETSPNEQAQAEAQAKWEKKKRQKHFENIDEIDKENFISPTLASPLKDRKQELVFPALIQIKYNGVCCIFDKEFGPRSRKGERFYNVKHLESALKPVFDSFPNIVLHGELFNPELKKNLNRLIRLVAVTRKEKDLTPDLIKESEEIVRLYIYDGYIKGQESLPYTSRLRNIKFILNKFFDEDSPIRIAPTTEVNNLKEAKEFADNAISNGEEGAILRMSDMPYIHKRSRDIIKLKHIQDAEFEVISFEEGKGNWSGMAKAVWCKLPNGEKFKSNIRGTQEFLKDVWENPEPYIGEMITCDFPEYSEYGVPQHAYSDLIKRNYE